METIVALADSPHGPFAIRSAQIDTPRAGEVLVRITGVGLCHTDLVARDQFIPIALPAVLGHEGAGIVEAIGLGVTKVKAGDRIVIGFGSCGHCSHCEQGLPSYCRDFAALNYVGTRMDGSVPVRIEGVPVSSSFFGQSSFAQLAITTERNVVKVEADDVPLEIMGPLGCGLQTGAGGVMRSLACPKGSSIAIFGGGPVGLAAVMGAVLQQCATIILVEPVPARRALALELGATNVIDPGEIEPASGIRAISPDGVDFAFDTSGLKHVIETSLTSLAGHGTLGLVGVPPCTDSSISLNIASLLTNGHRIMGIIEGDSEQDSFIPELIDHFRAGRFPFDKMITRFPLDQINEAIAAQRRGECIKVVLIP
jgi:aryl-alcohol dehydrogenase